MPLSTVCVLFLCLQFMLFWQRKTINIFTFLHMAVVLLLFAGAHNVSNYFLLEGITSHEASEIIFSMNIAVLTNGIIPLFCLWLYQDWQLKNEGDKVGVDFWNF